MATTNPYLASGNTSGFSSWTPDQWWTQQNQDAWQQDPRATAAYAPGSYEAQQAQPQTAQGVQNPYTGTAPVPPAQQGMPKNPYLPDIGNAITASSNQNLMQTVLPSINRNAVATGGYGGARQGLAQGTAIGNAQTGINQALASMYGGAYANDQGLAQQKYATDVGANTAKYGYDTNSATNKYNTDVSGATQNRNLDLQQNQQGYNQFWDTINNQLGMGKAQTAVGDQQYAAGKDPLSLYRDVMGIAPGMGGTTTKTDPASGGGLAGAAGGALSAAQLYQLIFGTKP